VVLRIYFINYFLTLLTAVNVSSGFQTLTVSFHLSFLVHKI
jgi:hypothetical protein